MCVSTRTYFPAVQGYHATRSIYVIYCGNFGYWQCGLMWKYINEEYRDYDAGCVCICWSVDFPYDEGSTHLTSIPHHLFFLHHGCNISLCKVSCKTRATWRRGFTPARCIKQRLCTPSIRPSLPPPRNCVNCTSKWWPNRTLRPCWPRIRGWLGYTPFACWTGCGEGSVVLPLRGA